jgi:hypothetical protein
MNKHNAYHFIFKERIDLMLKEKSSSKLLFLVAVSASSFLALMRCNLMSFSFFTAWHSNVYFKMSRHYDGTS